MPWVTPGTVSACWYLQQLDVRCWSTPCPTCFGTAGLKPRMQVSTEGSSTVHNYYNLACELLATSVSAAEICAGELLRGPTSCLAALGPPAADGHAPDTDKPQPLLAACISAAESRRWLCALVASLRLADCLKDAKADLRRVVCRAKPDDLGIHDVEGQQLLFTVQVRHPYPYWQLAVCCRR